MKQWFASVLPVRPPMVAWGVAPPSSSALDDIRAFGFTFACGFIFFSLFFA